MRIAALASGGGSVLEAILERRLPVAVVLVDRPCGAEAVARGHGVASVLVERDSFGPGFDRVAYTDRVVDALRVHDVALLAMAGFMTVLAEAIFTTWPGRVVNTHPALLPAFRGAHAVRDALSAGATVTGCTIHVATPAVDDGPVLAQETVPVLAGDDEATLHERIKAVERRLYPETLAAIVERGAVLLDPSDVTATPPPPAPGARS